MTYQPLPYEDADSTTDMRLDCGAATVEMSLPWTSPDLTAKVMGAAPSIAYDDYPREIRKSEITVSEAAVALAAKLHLSLD